MKNTMLFVGNGGCHCFSVWQLAAPSLLSTPPLSAVLQSAKLLSVSLERHMLTLSSHYLPHDSLSHSLTLTRYHTHTCMTPGLYIFHRTWIWLCENREDLYCACISAAGRCFGVNIHAWWELHWNAGTDLHTVAHECTHEPGTQKHRCFSVALYKQAFSVFSCLFFLSPYITYSKQDDYRDWVVPYIINGGEKGGTQVLCHGVVSILTCADFYSSFPPETGGRHYIQMVSCKWWIFFFLQLS